MEALGALFVHPHPDDETIACGGSMARAVDQGRRVKVVTCTGGEAGSNLAGIDLGDVDLPTHRRRELEDALAALGVTDHTWLGYRDSGMAGTEDNDHPDAFHQADLDEAAGRLAEIIRAFRPSVVISDDEHGTYGHPDHVKANRVTVRAVELAADPGFRGNGAVWQVSKRYEHTLSKSRMLEAHEQLVSAGLESPFGEGDVDEDSLPFGTDDERVTTRVDITPWLDRKRAALAAHRSQIAEDSFFLNVPDEMAGDFFGLEEFVLVGAEPGTAEDDLFAGLEQR